VTAQDEYAIPDLANALRPAVMKLARRLRQMTTDPFGPSSSQLSAMAVLLDSGIQRIGALAAAEKMQPPSMTRIVNSLEERGLVTRSPDPSDGRQCFVGLTDAGREMLLANRRRRDEWLAVRIAELTPADRDTLRHAVDILDRVNHA
jgi:DNA-binding MarR family transcriptional regulator